MLFYIEEATILLHTLNMFDKLTKYTQAWKKNKTLHDKIRVVMFLTDNNRTMLRMMASV